MIISQFVKTCNNSLEWPFSISGDFPANILSTVWENLYVFSPEEYGSYDGVIFKISLLPQKRQGDPWGGTLFLKTKRLFNIRTKMLKGPIIQSAKLDAICCFRETAAKDQFCTTFLGIKLDCSFLHLVNPKLSRCLR